MPKLIAEIPMQPMTSSSSSAMPVPQRLITRSASGQLVSRTPRFIPRRSLSFDSLHRFARAVDPTADFKSSDLSVEIANSFLKKAGLDITLCDGKLVKIRDNGEAHHTPSSEDLARIGKALILAPETPAKLAVAGMLARAGSECLLEISETDTTHNDFAGKLKSAARAYCQTLGGRDLAIDDTIATLNTYFFDRIGKNQVLRGANITAAALTILLMLVPTIGKNLPIISKAVSEGRYRDAILPALSICAITAMTFNPIAAAMGYDRVSAIIAATGNALMVTNLAEILPEGGEWINRIREDISAETHPFTSFAHTHGLIDKGVHIVLDFLHEIAAQLGFLVLNVMNAAGSSKANGNPMVFPLLTALFLPAVMEVTTGEQPFAEFEKTRGALADALTSGDGSEAIRSRITRQFLQQKIAATYEKEGYNTLARPLMERSKVSHIVRPIGANTLSDREEIAFLKGLFDRFCRSLDERDAAHNAIDRIYRFESFDPAQALERERELGEILRGIQTERNKDKSFVQDTRGICTDHVYRNIIAYVVRCVAFEELGAQPVHTA